MPLPAGFKVNGSKVTKAVSIPVPPRVQKMIQILDALASDELVTTSEFSERLGRDLHSGGGNTHPALRDYREKVDNRMFWGSRQSIASLRKQLAEPEESND
jgi:hypothetical protein